MKFRPVAQVGAVLPDLFDATGLNAPMSAPMNAQML